MSASIIRNLVAVAIPILLVLAAGAQNKAAQVEYKSGQVWQLSGGDETVTVLKVDDLPKIGRIVHVRVDKVPAPGCRGIHLTTSIDHIALTEKMMRKSPVTLLEAKTDLPDSYFDAYREWRKLKKPYVRKDRTVWDVIRTTLQMGAICNFLPAETT
jgi:hypothetical protein